MSSNLPRSTFSLNSTSEYHNPLLLPSSNPSQPQPQPQHHHHLHHHHHHHHHHLPDDHVLDDPDPGFRDSLSFHSASPDYHNGFSGEVDERDRSNPLVLHNARLQLARPPTPPLPITRAPSSLKSPLPFHPAHHLLSPLPTSQSSAPSPSSSNPILPPPPHHSRPTRSEKWRRPATLLAQPPPHPRFSNLSRTGPAAATMSLEPAHAVIPPTTASLLPRPSSSWAKRPTHDRRSSLPADGIPVHGACYPPRELGGKAGRAGELLERVMSREPVRLRDVVLRVTFTFDEHHQCAAGCRRAMVLLGRMRTTLPPGPMNPIRVGDTTVQPPLPSIRHEPCGLGRLPQVDVEWSDGTWQAFEPLNMTCDEILKKCHFDPTKAFY